MKLPESAVLAAKQALQSLWEDRAQVSRRVRQGNTSSDQIIYPDIACHLSAASTPTLIQTSNEARAASVYTVYVDPGLNINSGDTLSVRHKDQTIIGHAGIPFRRNLSLVVPLQEVTIA